MRVKKKIRYERKNAVITRKTVTNRWLGNESHRVTPHALVDVIVKTRGRDLLRPFRGQKLRVGYVLTLLDESPQYLMAEIAWSDGSKDVMLKSVRAREVQWNQALKHTWHVEALLHSACNWLSIDNEQPYFHYVLVRMSVSGAVPGSVGRRAVCHLALDEDFDGRPLMNGTAVWPDQLRVKRDLALSTEVARKHRGQGKRVGSDGNG